MRKYDTLVPVNLAKLVFICTFECPEWALAQTDESCPFPPLVQKLVKFLQLFTRCIVFQHCENIVGLGSLHMWTRRGYCYTEVEVAEEEQV
jgi:hypothetical protein